MRARLNGLDLYYGWFVVCMCFIGAMVTFGTIYSFSVFFEHILTEFDRSYADVSTVFSLQSIVTFTSAGFLGIFIDRYGVRRVFLVGTGLIVLGLSGASQLSSFVGVVISYGVVAGTGLGIIFVASFATVPRWFDRRRGLATGIAASGNGVGVLLWPPIASTVIARFGWRNSYALMTGLIVFLLLVVASVLDDHPGKIDAGTSKYITKTSNLSDLNPEGGRLSFVLDIARSKGFGFLFLGFLFGFTPVYVVVVFMVEFTATTGLGRGVGVLAVSVIGFGNVVGTLTAGFISDRAGIVRTFVFSCGLLGGSAILMSVALEPIALLSLGVVFGLGYGGIATLQPLLIAGLFGTVNVRSLFGLTAPAFAIAGSVVPFAVGFWYDLIADFTLAFIVGGSIGLLAAIVVPLGHRIHRRSRREPERRNVS